MPLTRYDCAACTTLLDVIGIIAADLVTDLRKCLGDSGAQGAVHSLMCTCISIRTCPALCNQLRALLWQAELHLPQGWPLGTRPLLAPIRALHISGTCSAMGFGVPPHLVRSPMHALIFPVACFGMQVTDLYEVPAFSPLLCAGCFNPTMRLHAQCSRCRP